MLRAWVTESVSERLPGCVLGRGPSHPEVLVTLPGLEARPRRALSVEASLQGRGEREPSPRWLGRR